MKEEIWKAIEGFEDYAISTFGNVKRITPKQHTHINKIIKPYINNCGYYVVVLSQDKKKFIKLIHRLVAKAFIENPNNLTDVDHIDNNKLNNNVINLQWLSHRDNMIKMHNSENGILGHIKQSKTCAQKRKKLFNT